jgi:hypothetical protein
MRHIRADKFHDLKKRFILAALPSTRRFPSVCNGFPHVNFTVMNTLPQK